MTSSSSSKSRERRNIKPEPDPSAISDSSSPPPKTPSKRPRSTPSKTPSSPTKQEGWTPELRLKLFEAYEACSQVKWDDVADKVSRSCLLERYVADEKMGNGKKAKECREQWQRTTGKRIKAALGEKS